MWRQMVAGGSDVQKQQLLTEALQYLQSALDLLDRSDASAHIGAHVDLAVHQLREVIDGCLQTEANAEPQ